MFKILEDKIDYLYKISGDKILCDNLKNSLTYCKKSESIASLWDEIDLYIENYEDLENKNL